MLKKIVVPVLPNWLKHFIKTKKYEKWGRLKYPIIIKDGKKEVCHSFESNLNLLPFEDKNIKLSFDLKKSKRRKKSKLEGTAYLYHGSLSSVSEGATTRVLNLAKYAAKKCPPFYLVNIIREEDNFEDYIYLSKKFKLSLIILDPSMYYIISERKKLLVFLKSLGIKTIISKDINFLLHLIMLNQKLELGLNFILDSHDVFHELAKNVYKSSRKEVNEMIEKEILLGEYAKKIICVSDEDKKKYIKIGVPVNKLAVVYNVIDLKELNYSSKHGNNLIFLGNLYYPPNEEAVKIIIDKLAPEILKFDSTIKIFIIGAYPKNLLSKKISKNIIFTGWKKELNLYFKKSSFLIAPIYSGSGSRVKILYSLAYGVPVLTTSKGAEGLIKNEAIIIEDDLNKFLEKIIFFMGHKNMINKLRDEGRRTIEKYYSSKINAKKLCDLL